MPNWHSASLAISEYQELQLSSSSMNQCRDKETADLPYVQRSRMLHNCLHIDNRYQHLVHLHLNPGFITPWSRVGLHGGYCAYMFPVGFRVRNWIFVPLNPYIMMILGVPRSRTTGKTGYQHDADKIKIMSSTLLEMVHRTSILFLDGPKPHQGW